MEEVKLCQQSPYFPSDNRRVFAIGLACFCHRFGKVLPCLWHSCANSMAKACQCDGTTWQKYRL
ncbi:hypothetical protein DXA68_00460 [Bacteroides stercorirosoris]|uniref:Uncharacterized protein n=1 Tax=Bacteroides stercorirosoris TaxID=871324 RepID=A0A413HC98_9BACE|nr:hypothetical protein DXA68_00460 [Bacteroides stercorirosoris]